MFPTRRLLSGRRFIDTVRLATGLRLAGLALAVSGSAFLAPQDAQAAGASYGWKNPICDMSTSLRKLAVAPPLVTAYDDTAATDRNTIRYWTRLYDAATGAAITGWFYAGQAVATDTTYAPFTMAGRTFGQGYGVQYTINTSAKVRVQYSIAWYRADGTLRATATPSVTQYKLATSIYMSGSGYVPVLTSTVQASC